MFTDPANQFETAVQAAFAFMVDGGPSIWAIGTVSVLGLTVCLWKIWRLMFLGAWGGRKVASALAALERGNIDTALALTQTRRGVRSRFLTAAIAARETLPEADAEAEVTRIAKQLSLIHI